MVHIAALLNGELCLTLQNGSAGGTSLSIVTLPRMCRWYCLAITLVFLGYLSGVTMGFLGYCYECACGVMVNPLCCLGVAMSVFVLLLGEVLLGCICVFLMFC